MADEKSSSKAAEVREVLQEIPAVFSALADHLPKLVASVREAMFSEQAGRELGKSIGALYQSLKEAGLPDEMALSMCMDYMAMQKSMMQGFKGFGFPGQIQVDRGGRSKGPSEADLTVTVGDEAKQPREGGSEG